MRKYEQVPYRGSLAERRQIGSYYTPANVAAILCEWAIDRPTDSILEPGFGGCDILEASDMRLRNLGCREPNHQLFGCDLDPNAFAHLHSRLGLTQVSRHFVLGDFLALEPTAFDDRRFKVVIGNPPYVRHHALTREQRQLGRSIRDRLLPGLSLQASLWAHFVLHASEFLEEGGRVAWLLPSSFMHAYYARPLRTFLAEHFKEVLIFALNERLFKSEGANESTVVVVARDWHQEKTAPCIPRERSASSVEELRSLLLGRAVNEIKSGKIQKAETVRRGNTATFDHIATRAQRLGDICKFSIGVVTGDTNFFLFDRAKAEAYGISSANLKHIVSRATLVSGLSISEAELQAAFESGVRSKILDTSRPLNDATKAYLETMSEERKAANLTFSKRPLWHQPLDGKPADAFFTCMSHHGPRLALNISSVTCTNSLYRTVFANEINDLVRRLTVLSMTSTFGQLSAEFCGRSYSSGMLKHEPSEAANIRLLLPDLAEVADLDAAFAKIDRLLKQGDYNGGRDAADSFIISRKIITAAECLALRSVLDHTRALRQASRAQP